MADKNYGLVATVTEGNDHNVARSHSSHRRTYGEAEKPLLKRYINLSGILNFGFTLQAGWEGLGLTLSLAFLNGGPSALVWGAVIAGFGHTMVALSLGEMASMDPTVGAQYRWSARFTRKFPEYWGLVQGWISVFAWIFSAGAGFVIMATTVQGLIAFLEPNYLPKQWHITLLMWAFLILAIICNLYLPTILNAFETFGGICHVLFFIACIIVLTTLGNRASASYVFATLYSDVSGWNNPGISFNLGILVAATPLANYDSVLHMIDETHEPRKRVPKSMFISVILNSVMAFAYAICLMFCVGDVAKVSASANPLVEIYYLATKSKTATTIIVVMHASIVLIGTMNCVASACRLTWAFARDKGLPFHEFFTPISNRFQIPLRALALNSVVAALLALINLGSTTALSALISLPAGALMLSYCLPIVFLTTRKLKGEHPRYGPFKLGSWGLPVNLFAICFSLYLALWLSWPISYPVIDTNMNYCAPILLGLILVVQLDWFTTGKTRFKVPTGQYNIEYDVELDDNNAKTTTVTA